MTKKIQYFHDRNYSLNGDISSKGGRTICAEMLTTFQLASFLDDYLDDQEKDMFTLNIGEAFCHPQDRYSKKEGAKLSQERLKPTSVRLDKICIENLMNIMNVTFMGDNFKVQLRVYLPDRDRYTRLIFFENV